MKLRKITLLFLMVMVLPFLNKAAVAETGFSTEPLSAESQKSMLEFMAIERLDSEPESDGIICFDVNEDGLIALGFDYPGTKRLISIYSQYGEFQYGYTFNDYGTFDVEWDQHLLNIYSVRGGRVISVDQQGRVVDLLAVPRTSDNIQYAAEIAAKHKHVDSCSYELRNDMGILNYLASSYSQLVKRDSHGAETILYDVNEFQTQRTILTLVVVVTFMSVVSFIVIRGVLKRIVRDPERK